MSVPQGKRGFSRSPDARTRQIQIRNRQRHLHTAASAGWQARGGSASGWTFGSRRPDLGSFGGRFWRNLAVRQQPRLVMIGRGLAPKDIGAAGVVEIADTRRRPAGGMVAKIDAGGPM